MQAIGNNILEIERKFRISLPLAEILKRGYDRQFSVEQSYLGDAGDWTIRIRKIRFSALHEEYRLTLKKPISMVRTIEVETDIDADFYYDMAEQCGKPLHKTRYEIFHGDYLWEVDHYTDAALNDLVIAEIELTSEDELFDLPDWVGEEVSHEKQYKNHQLVKLLD